MSRLQAHDLSHSLGVLQPGLPEEPAEEAKGQAPMKDMRGLIWRLVMLLILGLLIIYWGATR